MKITFTFTSLILLSIFFLLFLIWLIIKTLKEGKEALIEIRRDRE